MHQHVPRSSTRDRRLAVVVAVVLVAAVLAGLVAAVGGGAGGDAAAATREPVVVTAVDYAFENLPEEVSAGTRLVLRNASTTEAHELVTIRLADDDDRSVDEIAALGAADLAAAGEITGIQVADIAGGDVAVVAGSDVVAEPGRYVVICTLPLGADSEAAVAGDPAGGGPPHAAAGMYAQLVVR